MNRRRYILCSLATGFIVVTLWSLMGFWGRWFCWHALVELTPKQHRTVSISPLGLVSEELENDPNVLVHSRVTMTINPSSPYISGLGMVDYIRRHIETEAPPDIIYRSERDEIPRGYARLDRRRGLIVGEYFDFQSETDNPKRVKVFIGPNGRAESPAPAIGRFHSPLIGKTDRELFVLYDRKLQCFLEPWKDGRGPELDLEDSRRPIQIETISRSSENMVFEIDPPMREVKPNEPKALLLTGRRENGKALARTLPLWFGLNNWKSVPVLDASGRISGLNVETLELEDSFGWLPGVPEPFIGTSSRAVPQTLSAYKAVAIRTGDYAGCVVGVLNYDGSEAALAIYDKAGTRIASVTAPMVVSSPLVSTIRFGLENLHSPALSLASFFSAPYCQGGSGYRSIYVQPDSLIAKKGRRSDRLHILVFLDAVMLILPGLMLAGGLSVLLIRRTGRIGFSKNTRILWLIATVAFGVPAYLTYRLTEPRGRLVTCRNCGKLRRPDMDRCHYCQSLWEVPELIAPAWRVLDMPQDSRIDSLSELPEQEPTEPDSPAEREAN